ncbi:MAG: hypothetical protein CMN30_31025 [Sandaracinus sp.]|nr:hypothetical protein [Sandaracinus sp.]
MVVSNLAGDEIRQEVTVDSPNWMAALRAGRTEIGESGGVPTGSSCSVSPEGTVTILDPMARRRFVLAVANSESFVPPAAPKGPVVPPDEAPKQAAPEQPPAPEAAPAPETAPEPKKRNLKQTMAYMPAAEAPAAAPPKKKVPKRTMAYIPVDQVPKASEPAPAQASPSETAPAPQPAEAPKSGFGPASSEAPMASPAPAASPATDGTQAESPAPAPQVPDADAPSVIIADPDQGTVGATTWTLHLTRDAEPSPENPLTYRERSYTVAAGTSADDAEAVARERLAAVQASVAERPRGKFIVIAVFDHAWSQRPERPPLVTLNFKDWQDSLQVDRPLERLAAAARASRESAPPVAAEPAGRRTTDEHDQRLATAFEASQDLLFLSTPLEGLEFTLELFDDLLGTEAQTACLYDIDHDVYRVAAATGPGSDAIRGRAIPFQAGLFGAAAKTPQSAMRVPNATSDPRFDEASDGREGLAIRDLMYVPLVAQGRSLGMVQLVNRSHAKGFSQADTDLATYVGQQLARFLYQARLKGVG